MLTVAMLKRNAERQIKLDTLAVIGRWNVVVHSYLDFKKEQSADSNNVEGGGSKSSDPVIIQTTPELELTMKAIENVNQDTPQLNFETEPLPPEIHADDSLIKNAEEYVQ